MGVKVYSLNEAPETPSPEIDVNGGEGVLGEAYENVSMLEFSLLVHEHEQNMFEAVIATDFMEAVNEQVMLEDGEEAPAADDAGEAKPSFADKAKEIGGKAADVAAKIKDKIVELITAFVEKLKDFSQKVRKKIGDLLKMDKKLEAGFTNAVVEKLKNEKWQGPEVHGWLVSAMFSGVSGKDVISMEDHLKVIQDVTEKVVNTVNRIKQSNAKIIPGLKEETLGYIKEASEKLDAAVEHYKQEEANKNKGRNGNEGQVLVMQRYLKNAIAGYGFKSIEKGISDETAKIQNIRDYIKSIDANREVDKVRMHDLNEIVTAFMNMISKFNSSMTSMYSRAYADVRKYALAAIAHANKSEKAAGKEKKVKQESVEWFVCEASDEYVFNTLTLI